MAAKVERDRTEANEQMAAVFDSVDFIISATNPDIAYPADVMTNTRVGDQLVGIENNGALTIPANIVGNPSISVPIGLVHDLPVGMQIMGRHHTDALLLDLALVVSASVRGRSPLPARRGSSAQPGLRVRTGSNWPPLRWLVTPSCASSYGWFG